jgi:hypothetical protein
MRSRLEADWAATFDFYDITWEYEPDAVKFGEGIKYLPDFHLPMQRVWVEAKGPGDDNIEKPLEFQKALDERDQFKWDFEKELVIIGRPSRAGSWCWEGTTPAQDIVLIVCSNCQRYSFMDYSGTWKCRFCHWEGKDIWNGPGGNIWWPGQLAFSRAPRSSGRAA